MKCCDFYAGRLKHAALLQEYIATDDGYGGKSYEWRTIDRIKCRFEQKGNGEKWHAEAMTNTARYVVEARYNDKIKANMRLLFNCLTFKIVGINNVEFANKWLLIDVEQGVPT